MNTIARIPKYAVVIQTDDGCRGEYVTRWVGPAYRSHVMAAMRKGNYYEVALVGPDCPNAIPPVYACGYSDQLDCVGEDGCVPVPDGPGLGVVDDWDFFDRHRRAQIEFGR